MEANYLSIDMNASAPVIEEQHIRLFRLTASVLKDGVGVESQAVISSMPSVASHLEDGLARDQTGRYMSLDRDVAYRMSAYVDRDDRAELDRELTHLYHSVGMTASNLPVDHVANMLESIARMAEQSRDALATSTIGLLLYWIHPLSRSVDRFDTRIATTLVHFVEEMMTGWNVEISWRSGAARIDTVIENEGVLSPRQLASHLANPDQCGVFIGRDDLVEAGREIGVPAGFGGRLDMLATLIEGARRYGHLKQLIDVFAGDIQSELTAYDRFRHPAAERWRENILGTLTVLRDERLCGCFSEGDLV